VPLKSSVAAKAWEAKLAQEQGGGLGPCGAERKLEKGNSWTTCHQENRHFVQREAFCYKEEKRVYENNEKAQE